MGNAGSSSMHSRERHKSSDISTPNSPFRELPQRERGEVGGAAAAFTFDKKRDSVLQGGSSQEDDETTSEPYYTNIGKASNEEQPTTADTDEFSSTESRKRSSTISEGISSKEMSSSQHNDSNSNEKDNESQKEQEGSVSGGGDDLCPQDDPRNPSLPTVLRWDGGGRNVMICGTFTKWKPIPMVRSHGNFVTIIDLPEGDHHYKFFVDGEWKHDPKLVSFKWQYTDDSCEKSILMKAG